MQAIGSGSKQLLISLIIAEVFRAFFFSVDLWRFHKILIILIEVKIAAGYTFIIIPPCYSSAAVFCVCWS